MILFKEFGFEDEEASLTHVLSHHAYLFAIFFGALEECLLDPFLLKVVF